MAQTVMDSTAVLASIFGEPGADIVNAGLAGSFISAINLAEVASKLIQDGVPDSEATAIVRRLGVQFVDVDEEQALAASLIHATTRSAGISIGDAFCLALGKLRGCPVLTADRAWKTLNLGVEVTLIR
jgi:PIN domain nuclease of toxin-antitoxin system